MFKKCLTTVILLGIISGCSWLEPYTPPVEQGNRIDPKKAKLIRVGMSKSALQKTMGAPVYDNVFDKNRWDYVYTLNKDAKIVENKRITVWFKGNTVRRVSKN